MYIKVTKTDCQKIVNKNLQVGGGSENSPLEIALAKYALTLHERLGAINNERNEFFETLYSIRTKLENAAGERLANKRKADLAGTSKAAFAQAVKLDTELKKMEQ